MAAVSEHMQTWPSCVVDLGDVSSQGMEGRQYHKTLEAAFEHWCDRSDAASPPSHAGGSAGGDLEDGFFYVPIPPQRTFRVRGRYVLRGKGQPMAFDLEPE